MLPDCELAAQIVRQRLNWKALFQFKSMTPIVSEIINSLLSKLYCFTSKKVRVFSLWELLLFFLCSSCLHSSTIKGNPIGETTIMMTSLEVVRHTFKELWNINHERMSKKCSDQQNNKFYYNINIYNWRCFIIELLQVTLKVFKDLFRNSSCHGESLRCQGGCFL